MPHGFCYLWSPALLWTLIVSETVIVLAYFSIPVSLLLLIRKRKDFNFHFIFKLFSAFIFACGITHLFGIWTIWHPDYWLDAFAKVLTAIVSLVTAVMFWPLIPRLLKQPTTAQLQELITNLEREVVRRKETEAELIRLKSVSDERFRILFDSTRDALVIMNAAGACMDANPAAVEMYEYNNVEELKYQTPASVSPEFQPDDRRSDEKAMEMIALTMEKGSHLFEWMHKKKNGSLYPVEVLLTKIQFGGETFFISNARDISERKQTEIALIEAKQIAEKSTQLKSEFLAKMSHEIRTPMSAIIGFVDLARRTELSPKQRNYLDKVNTSAKWLLGIINDILDFSKIEAGKLQLDYCEFKLSKVIQYLDDVTSALINDKHLTISFELDPEAPDVFIGDPLRLGQVLLNLLTNAIKFTKAGSVTVKMQLINFMNDQAHLLFSVNDTGIGIAVEQQIQMFEAFNQADNATTRIYGGTGLGLTISKHLVEAMDGVIGVESKLGVGSRFYFTVILGVQTKDKPKLPQRQAMLPARFAMLDNIRLLLVEDNPINQEMMLNTLLRHGIQADLATNGEEAVAMINKHNYSIVLMDCLMPVMDGYEASRIIRADPRFADLPIIAMTANVMAEERQHCIASGMNDHIGKPIDWERLFILLVQWVKLQPPGELIETNPKAADDKPVFPILTGVETDDVEQQMGGNVELYCKMLNLFRSRHSDDAALIRAAYQAKDYDAAVNITHNLLGSASFMQMFQLSGLVADLDQALKQRNETTLDQLLEKLDADLALLINEINRI